MTRGTSSRFNDHVRDPRLLQHVYSRDLGTFACSAQVCCIGELSVSTALNTVAENEPLEPWQHGRRSSKPQRSSDLQLGESGP